MKNINLDCRLLQFYLALYGLRFNTHRRSHVSSEYLLQKHVYLVDVGINNFVIFCPKSATVKAAVKKGMPKIFLLFLYQWKVGDIR